VIGKATREAIFKRDNFKCLNCGSSEELTIDHIVPKSQGGGNNYGNLQTLCQMCNKYKGCKVRDVRPHAVLIARIPEVKRIAVKKFKK